MALPAKPFRISIVFALAAAGVTAANAQSLNNPSLDRLRRGAVRRARSAKFVFCDGRPGTLHQAPVRPASPPPAVQERSCLRLVIQAARRTFAREESGKKPLKKKRKKPAIQYECKPVSKPK
jgi:hypothetical protein